MTTLTPMTGEVTVEMLTIKPSRGQSTSVYLHAMQRSCKDSKHNTFTIKCSRRTADQVLSVLAGDGSSKGRLLTIACRKARQQSGSWAKLRRMISSLARPSTAAISRGRTCWLDSPTFLCKDWANMTQDLVRAAHQEPYERFISARLTSAVPNSVPTESLNAALSCLQNLQEAKHRSEQNEVSSLSVTRNKNPGRTEQ